jgi:hypothetical protein
MRRTEILSGTEPANSMGFCFQCPVAPNPKNPKAMPAQRAPKFSKVLPSVQEFHLSKKAKIGTSGAVVGAIVAGPIGALVGGVLGTALGAAASVPAQKAAAKKKPRSKAKPLRNLTATATNKKMAPKRVSRTAAAKKR